MPDRIHIISIGGAVMHNIALELKRRGHSVTGSDDEVYDPSKSRLENAGLLPHEMGWNAERITHDLDYVILGMHAKGDNPELKKAKELELPIYSFPEFIFRHSRNKKRLVIAGSHGKTTTTGMVVHVLNYYNKDFDFLLGADVESVEGRVRLSDAPLIVIEGDEYFSSALQPVPKMNFYRPHIAVITGIAHDHMNIFPTFENYQAAFRDFIASLSENGICYYYSEDPVLKALAEEFPVMRPYGAFPYQIAGHVYKIPDAMGDLHPMQIFGEHNMENMRAAQLLCEEADINERQFLKAMETFRGTGKRQELLASSPRRAVYLDFAHAPSKVEATVKAFREKYPKRSLICAVELHTYSSLNKSFIPLYKGTLDPADIAFVFYSEQTLKIKKMPPLEKVKIATAFDHDDLKVYTEPERMKKALLSIAGDDAVLLLMTSGRFGYIDLKLLADQWVDL